MKTTARKATAKKKAGPKKLLVATVRIDSSSIKEIVDGLREEFRAKIEKIEASMQATGTARFTTLDDGSIHDIKTNLIWSSKVIKASNWADAKAKAAEVEIAGAKGRLPECDELLSIVDRSVCKPAADHQFFKFLDLSDWYWSNTVHAGDSSYAWYVRFGSGHCGGSRQGDDGLVLAVRSASQ